MTDRITNLANNFKTTLSADMGSTDLTATVVTTAGAPSSPCFLVIDADNPAKREVVYFDGSFTGTTLVTTLLANRYLQGSAAASGISHTSGAEVTQTALSQHVIDLNDRITADEGVNAGHRTGTPDAHHAKAHQLDHAAGGADALSGNLNATARVGVRRNSGGGIVSRRRINAIEGTGIALTLADDAANEETDLTIAVSQANVDHGSIGGLADDDHPFYLTYARHDGAHPLGYSQGTSDLTLTTVFQFIPGSLVNVTPARANANILVTLDMDFDVQSSGGGFAFGRITVDGEALGPDITLGASAVGVWPCSRSVAGGVVVAGQTYAIRAAAAKQTSGGVIVASGLRCSITVRLID